MASDSAGYGPAASRTISSMAAISDADALRTAARRCVGGERPRAGEAVALRRPSSIVPRQEERKKQRQPVAGTCSLQQQPCTPAAVLCSAAEADSPTARQCRPGFSCSLDTIMSLQLRCSQSSECWNRSTLLREEAPCQTKSAAVRAVERTWIRRGGFVNLSSTGSLHQSIMTSVGRYTCTLYMQGQVLMHVRR